MPKVIYIEFNGTHHEVEVPVGTSLMRGAVDNCVPGIDADCDGNCACATCHVYLEPEWRDKVGRRSEIEEEMLEFAALTRPESRLACQIQMVADLDGLAVRMPEAQH